MKQLFYIILVLFVLIISLSKQSFAQNWLDGKPNWEFKHDCKLFNYETGYRKFLFQRDTVIDGRLMKVMKHEYYSNSMGDVTSFEQEEIWYDTLGSIYEYKNDVLDKGGIRIDRNNFSYEINDTVVINLDEEFIDTSVCDLPQLVTLDTITEIVKGGKVFRQQIWKTANNTFITERMRIIEGIGIVNHVDLFRETIYLEYCPVFIVDECRPYFSCYYNEAYDFAYPSEMCSNIVVATGEIEKSDHKISISPNPTDGLLRLNTDKTIKEIKIYDLLGKQVSYSINNQSIDLYGLPSAMYFVQVKLENSALPLIYRVMKK